MKSDDGISPAQDLNKPQKKHYVPPELIVHGSVEKLTENSGRGAQSDQQIGGDSKYSQ